MSHSFYEYKPKTGDFETRRNGVLIAFEEGVATFYALKNAEDRGVYFIKPCLLYTSPSPRDVEESRMPSSA